MISAIGKDIYTANAGVIAATPQNRRVTSVPTVERNDYSQRIIDNPTEVSLTSDAQFLMALKRGEKLPPQSPTKDEPVTDYTSSLKKKISNYKKDQQASGAQQEQPEKIDDDELTDSEKEMLEELKTRDTEVRTHEQQHIAAAGGYARGGPVYDYQTGPDKQQYAVGGHVDIDVSEEPTPEATLQKAQILKAAASAPAEPSAADRGVSAKASQMEANARQDLAEVTTDKKVDEKQISSQEDEKLNDEISMAEKKISSLRNKIKSAYGTPSLGQIA